MNSHEPSLAKYRRLASGMNSILIGAALILIDITFSMSEGSRAIEGPPLARGMRVDFVPDFIGYLLLAFGVRACAESAVGALRSRLTWVFRWYGGMVALSAFRVVLDAYDVDALQVPWRVVESLDALVWAAVAWFLTELCGSLALVNGRRAWRRLALFLTVTVALGILANVGVLAAGKDAVGKIVSDVSVPLLVVGAVLYLVVFISLFLRASLTARSEALWRAASSG